MSSIKYSELLYLEVHLLHVLFSIIHLIEKVSYESCKEAFSYKAVTNGPAAKLAGTSMGTAATVTLSTRTRIVVGGGFRTVGGVAHFGI